MNSLEKEFVPYELALALKQLGFDEPCLAYYNKKQLFSFTQVCNEPIKGHYIKMSNRLCAPTFSQAFRWFRDKHNLHAEITWSPSYEYDPNKWFDAIYEITISNVSYTKEWVAESPNMQRGSGKQLTYEETELACLKKLIEICCKK